MKKKEYKMETKEETISEAAAAKILNVVPSTMVNWRKSGVIPVELYSVRTYISGTQRITYFKEKFEKWKNSSKFETKRV